MPVCCLPDGGSIPQRFAVAAYQLAVGVYTKACDAYNGSASPSADGFCCWFPSYFTGFLDTFSQLIVASTNAAPDNPLIELLLRIFDIMFTIYLAIISLILYISINIIDTANTIICNINLSRECKEPSTIAAGPSSDE